MSKTIKKYIGYRLQRIEETLINNQIPGEISKD